MVTLLIDKAEISVDTVYILHLLIYHFLINETRCVLGYLDFEANVIDNFQELEIKFQSTGLLQIFLYG